MIFICFTTTAARVERLRPTLESVRAQTIGRSRIYVKMYAEAKIGPSYIDSVDDLIEDRLIDGFEPREDTGPIVKLSAIKDSMIDDHEDIVVTIDDDIIYEPGWLNTLIGEAEKTPDQAVGFSGWNVADFLRAERENDPSGGGYVWPFPGPCDVLEGWAGVAYRKSHFKFPTRPLDPPEMFRNVDDVWISYCLHRSGTARRVIGNPLAKERPDNTPGLHNRPDFVELNRRAAIKAFGG